jgi:hypothetical protein
MDDEDSSEVIMRCVKGHVKEDVKEEEVVTCVRHSSRITKDVGSTAHTPTHLNTVLPIL